MQPALLLVLLLPPPTAGALRLARRDRPRAWRASDRGEPPGMQRIDRHVVSGREGIHRVARPVEQRAELEQLALRVDGDETGATPVVRLIGPQPDNPSPGTRKRTT